MVTVSTKRLIEAVEEANAFDLPEMSTGTDYLYRNLYERLAEGCDVSLSDLDFNAFEPDDVDSVRELYYDVLEHNEYRSADISRSLRDLFPIAISASFV